MSVETPISASPNIDPQLLYFADSWKSKPKAQVIPEIASCKQESEHVVDAYSFTLRNGRLYSPTANCFVRDIIDTSDNVGRLESQAFSSIEQWFANTDQGIMFWVSPLDRTHYPKDSKMIMSEVLYIDGEKRLLNRAIILDYEEQQCLEFAQALSDYSINRPLLDSVDAVRGTPILLAADHCIDILEELIIDRSEVWASIRTGQDLIKQEQVLQQSELVYDALYSKDPKIVGQASASGFLGGGGVSCPTRRTAFEVFAANSLSMESCTKIKCPTCKWEPNQYQLQLISNGSLTSCPCCGYVPR